MQIYKVGGYVRDQLLSIPPKDCDYVVVGATKEIMLKRGFIQVGKHFPVFLHPITREEYALARSEKKCGVGHHGFQVDASPDISLKEDLYRRDLTINAIACDLEGNLIDPYGGINDIKNHILRHVSLAFKDDPLRILRVARFAATLNFSVASETMSLLKEMAANGEGKYIARERAIHELELALNGKFSQNFFNLLANSNNLTIFFPALESVNCNQFYRAITNANNIMQKYTILANYINPDEESLNQIVFNKKLRMYLKCTRLIYDNLANTLDNQQILRLLKKTQALRNLNYFITIIDNLVWFIKLNNQTTRYCLWCYSLADIANRLNNCPYKLLINQSMNNKEKSNSIRHWQLQTIQDMLLA